MSLILFTGDRNWTDVDIVDQTLRELRASEKPLMVVHGDCPTGLDHICRQRCEALGICEFRCPAEWKFWGLSADPRRNQWMFSLKPSYVMAFHPDISRSKGTKDTIKKAMNLRIECALYTGKEWLNPYRMVVEFP